MPQPPPYIKHRNDNEIKHHKRNYVMTLAQTNCIPHRKPRTLSAILITWIALARQRRALASLSDAQRDGIGINTQEAKKEANRAFWDVPTHWRS
jgi:uncharacterized protein YjiS (DUF1127 family)